MLCHDHHYHHHHHHHRRQHIAMKVKVKKNQQTSISSHLLPKMLCQHQIKKTLSSLQKDAKQQRMILHGRVIYFVIHVYVMLAAAQRHKQQKNCKTNGTLLDDKINRNTCTPYHL